MSFIKYLQKRKRTRSLDIQAIDSKDVVSFKRIELLFKFCQYHYSNTRYHITIGAKLSGLFGI